MPTLPWRWLRQPEPRRQYLVVLTYLPLKRGWRVPWILRQSGRIRAQLLKSRGVIGYSMRAELRAKTFWTLSAWEDEAILQRFVQAEPHAAIMTAAVPHMGSTRFVRWTAAGSNLPVGWDQALKRWQQETRPLRGF